MQKLFENFRKYLNEDEESDQARARELSKQFSTKEKSDKFDITDLDTVFPFLKTWVGRNPSIPLHIRAFTKYLIGPPNPFTEKDLSREEQQKLGNWLYEVRFDDRGIVDIGDGGFDVRYHNYDIALNEDAEDEEEKRFRTSARRYEKFYKDSGKQAFSADFKKQIQLFLGQFTVAYDKGCLYISDKYDFNIGGIGKKKSGILEEWLQYFRKGGGWPGWLGMIRKAAPYFGVSYQVDIKLPFKMFPDTWEDMFHGD